MSTQSQRTRLRRHTDDPDVAEFVPVSGLVPPPVTGATVCGSLQRVSGRAPLRCERAAGHAGDHAVHNALGEWLVRWSA